MHWEQSRFSGKALLWACLVVLVFVVVASYWFVLLMGYGFVFFTPQGLSTSMEPFPAYFLLLFVVGFYIPVESGTVFSLLLILYACCFGAAWKWRESFHRVVRRPLSYSFRRLSGNFLFAMPLISGMLLTAVIGIIYVQDVAGIPTGQPNWPTDTSQQAIFMQLAYAPFAEELGFRLIPIGLFMILYVFLFGRNLGGGGLKLLVASVLYPEGAKKAAGLPSVSEQGLWRGISHGEWAMIFITSLLYGPAHLLSGIGWEIGKITSVSLQGFVFALTYVAYGFGAPILLHWFFNYYLFFFDPEIVSKVFLGVEPVLSVVEIVIIVLGVAGWIAFSATAIQRYAKRVKDKQVPEITLPQQSSVRGP